MATLFLLQAITNIHLTPNYGVANLFKMLTYSHVCYAFSSVRALPLNVICIFEMACSWNGIYPFSIAKMSVRFHRICFPVDTYKWVSNL